MLIQERTSGKYRIGVTQDNNSRTFLKEEKVWRNNKILLERPNERDLDDPILLRQTHLEQITANKDFRYISDFFRSIRYDHIVPQLIRDPNRPVGQKFDPYGGDFLERIASVAKNTQTSRLRRIQNALRLAVPQLQEIAIEKDNRGIPHLKAKYDHWRGREAWQTEADFSDGTLRLMGLLWALMDGNGPLLLEEPELSLHAEVASHIPAMMLSVQKSQRRQFRQMFVSTYSSDLLRDPGIAAEEVLLFRPTRNGTGVEASNDIQEMNICLEAGLSMAEAVLPHTRPRDADRLALFDM